MADEASERANERQSQVELSLWPGVAAGLPVLVFGIALILINWLGFQQQPEQAWLLFAADGLVLAGIVIGWVSWFPDWAYAFAGMGLLFSLWWSSSTAGMDQFLGGPLAWSPLLVALALGIILTRSVRPLLRFLQGLLRDWSRASLGLYGLLPLAMYAVMSVMPAASAIVYQIVALVCMAAGAAIAGLTTRPRTRWRVLLLGMSWSWIIVTLGVALYWNGRVWEQTGLPVSWLDQVMGMSLIWMILALIVFFPAGIALAGRLLRKMGRGDR